jgi:hypothetical protein
MSNLTTRAGKGSPLTNNELDANFTNLNADKVEVGGDLSGTATAPNVAKIQGRAVSADAPEAGEKLVWNGSAWEPSTDPTGEPIGHADKSESTVSFNSGTRTFTIAPVAASFTVWCKGVKHTYTSAQTVVIPDTTGLHFIYFDASGVLSTQMTYFTWDEHAPTAYIYWNATTQQAVYFGDERHGITLDWQTHEYLHRTRGAAIASGFGASNYTTTGAGATDADAQIDIGGGTFFDEDLQVDIVSTNTPVAGTWQQDLSGPARIPVLYLSGSAWVIDEPTNFPFKVVSGVPQYNLYSGGTWSTAPVNNNEYFVTWILATHNLTYPVVAVISQAPTNQLSAAEAMTFEGLNLSGFPSVEFRPLYKVIYTHKLGFTNSVKASTVAVYDLRSLQSAGVAAALVQDHGNLSGLIDDDHPQYLHVSTVRTPSDAVKNSFLPSQSGNSGKYLTTDGSNPSWGAIPSGSLTFTGDVTGTGNTGSSTTLTLANSGVTAGTFTKVTVDEKGRVTNGASASSSDITTALGFTPENVSNKAVAGGYASLDGSGKVPSNQLPSYVDDVLEYANLAAFPGTGETGKIYVAIDSGKTYRWSGSAYVEISASPGSTDAVTEGSTNLYFTNARARAAVDAAGSLSYNVSTGIFSYTQPTNVSAFTNDSGYLTGITGTQVTTALGYTPYNSSNPSGYITSSALSSYLPLSGGTLTGSLFGTLGSFSGAVEWGNGSSVMNAGNPRSLRIGYSGGNYGAAGYGITFTTSSGVHNYALNDIVSWWEAYDGIRVYAAAAGAVGTPITWTTVLDARRNNSSMIFKGQTVLDAANYSSYALPLSGGTLTGNVGIGSGFNGFNNISGTEQTLYVANGNVASLYLHATGGSGRKYILLSSASGNLSIYDANADATRFTLSTGSANFSVALQQSGNQVLHAGNYGSGYFKTINGSSIIGTGDVTVSGTDSTKLPLTGGTISGTVTINGGSSQPLNLITSSGSPWGFGLTRSDAGVSSKIFLHNGSGSWAWVYEHNPVFYNGGAYSPFLHSGNYTSYSPSLTGSGASGTWGISVTGNSASVGGLVPAQFFNNMGNNHSTYTNFNNIPNFGAYYVQGSTNGPGTGSQQFYGFTLGLGNDYAYSSYALQLAIPRYNYDATSGGPDRYLSIRSREAGTWNAWQKISAGYADSAGSVSGGLTTSNYSSYALPLSGGTVTGQATFSKTDDHAISVGTIRGRAVGGQGGEFLHIYERVHIGSPSGWGSRSAPSYGLSTYGGCSLATDTGSVTIGGNTALHAGNYTSYSPSYSYFDDYQRGNYRVIADYGGFSTWYIRGDGRWVFARGHDWTVSFDLNLGSGTAGSNNGWAVLGQVTSNASNGTWRGVRFSQYVNGSQVDGDVRAQRYYLNNDSDYILNAGDGSMRLQNGNGYIDIGPKNSSWCHIYSDRTFYTNQDIYSYGNLQIHSGNYTSYAVGISNNSSLNSDSRNTRGVTRLYRRDDNSDYSIQTYWTGSHWYLAGYSGDNFHADCRVLYADTAGSADQIDGVAFRNTSSNAGVNADTLASNGITYYTSGVTNFSGNSTDGALYSQVYSGDWQHQIAGDYRSGQIALRGKNAGNWQSWRTVLDSGNYSSYAVPQSDVSTSGGGSKVLKTDANSYLYLYSWINTGGGGLFSSTNGAHWYPNSGSYGSWRADGTRNGWNGIEFGSMNNGVMSLMINPSSNESGFYNHSYGWQMRWYNGVGYVAKNAYGGNEATILDSSNYTSYTAGLSSVNTWTNTNYFRSNRNTTSSDPPLQAFSNDSGGAIMAFHRGGYYAVNMGLDSDNVFRIGGWSASANRLQMDMSGNLTMAGNVTAYSDERLKKDWSPIAAGFVDRLAGILAGTYTRIDSEERQAGVSAQKMREILPEVVSEDNEGTLALAYGNAAMVSAVELAKELVTLKKELAELKSRLH